MRKIIITGVAFFLITLEIIAQTNSNDDCQQYDGLKYVSIAQQLAIYGYACQDPLFLITAAQTLVDYPVKGALLPDSIILENAEISHSLAGAKLIQLNPYELLDDASVMAGSDTVVLAMVNRTREKAKTADGLPRGRKFSPLVQEYILNSTGKIKLWTTFNGNEIAEVFVMGNGSSLIDLYLYDNNGNLIASDMKNIDNCYISFTPPLTQQFSIEIRNIGKTENRCLLMTN